MTLTAGIPLVQLFDLANTVESVLPAKVREFVERFVAVDYSASHSDAAIFHRGSLAPVADGIQEIPTEFDIGIGRLSLPLLQTGIPFQLAFQRATTTGNLEPGADVWRLDLSLDVFTLEVDGLEPAILVPESGTTPRHLVRDPTRSSVRITGSAVLRIEVPSAGASVQVTLVDQPDPLDPTVPSGTVATVTCSPPHFFIGGSEFGLSVGRLTFDFSDTYSPPEVIARDQGPGWMGVAIQEATFYAPRNLPGIGDLSGGVKDVLIGSPVGLQGRLEIQFGRTAMDPSAFQFEQVRDGADLPLAISGAGTARTVTIQAAEDADVSVRAGFVAPGPPGDGELPDGALQDWKAEWRWPDGTSETGDASAGTVRHGQVLRVQPIETVTVDGDATDFPHPDVTFRFVAAGTRPSIDARIGGERFVNVTHVGGTREALRTVTFEAVAGSGTAGEFEWNLDGELERFSGPQYSPTAEELEGRTGHQSLFLREATASSGEEPQTRTAHVQLQVIDGGDLIVGCEAGVFASTDDGTRLALAAVEETWDLSDFHRGEITTRLEQATLDPADPSLVQVPADGLARVTLAPALPPPPLLDRHVQVLMDFDTANELRWGRERPAGATEGFSQADLLAWAARYAGAQFIVVGRCDDIGSDAYNATLAVDRATRGVALLTTPQTGVTGTPVDAGRVVSRGEQHVFAGASAAGDALEEDAEIALSAAEKSESVSGPTHGRLIHAEVPGSTGWPDARYVDGVLSEHEPVRDDYRRVDMWAVGGTPAPDASRPDDEASVGAALRRSSVPAAGADPVPVPPGSPALDYRVRLVIEWDSPTVSELKDAIPTLAEAEFAWTPQTMPLPAVDGEAVELSRETLTVFVNWAHDARTGYTKASLGIKSEGDPDGLISTETKPLVAALALAPALLSGVDADTDLIGAGARVAALLAGVAFAQVDLGGGPLVGDGSKVAVTSAAFETEMRSISDPGPDMQLRVVTDYVCTLHVNGGALGIRTADDQPMKIRYKRVGLEYDTSREGWERFGLVYSSTSLEIEDPGRWQIDGVLGSLLRIVEIGMGSGSLWIEGRIAIALDLGLIEITEAIIRLTFHDGEPLPSFELRGFVLRASIPNVLEGEGRLRIEDGGVIRAGVEATIIPAGLGVEAALALAKMGTEADPWIFLSLFMGVQFSTPLPLAQSGLALYGFKGLFTMNGSRTLGTNPDPIGRELDWWNEAPERKYDPDRGQFALGVGVVVGTMPDASFCVSCAGMLVVAFPDIEVILGVDVSIIEVPDTEASDEGGGSGTITGLIVIDDEAVKLAVSAQYTIPKVLEVKVPFGGYFPYPGTGEEVYVRLGSDGQTAFGRFGEPVTLKLLPGTLDMRAWTYLMVEQGGLPSLGGDPRFTFEGFSVGFGAGFEIGWSAGPIKLSASAKVLVGFGTAPLMIKGGIFVAGELDLVVVSISARGELILEAREFRQGDGSQDVAIRIEGEFCGEVDLFFFSISGCVGVSIDLSPDLIPPAPPSPVSGVALTDRRDRIMGVATTGAPAARPVFTPDDPSAGAAVSANNTVWPDTAPVVSFSHYVENAMGALAQFTPGPTPPQDRWFGSSALKYAYRLDSIVLRRRSDGALVSGTEPLQSVWTSSPYRQPDASGDGNPSPSEHEGPALKLLDWNPWAWVVNMANGGAGQPGDPVVTVDELCDPKPVPQRACVLGRSARRAGLNRVRMRQEHPPAPPYPSRFLVTGEPVVRLGSRTWRGRTLQSLITLAGGHVVPGAVVPLPFAATVAGETVRRGYRLPAARAVQSGKVAALLELALPWEGTFSEPVTDPSVLLMVCDAPGQRVPPDGGDRRCDDFRDLQPGPAVTSLQRPRFTVEIVAGGALLLLVDQADQRSEPATPGTDGSAEIRLPDAGATITLREPCDGVEVALMLFGGAVEGEALAADGTVLAADATPSTQGVEHRLRFAAPGIAAVRLRGGRTEALLLEVCVQPSQVRPRCEDFEGLKPSDKPFERLAWQGIAFEPVERGALVALSDRLDVGRTPPAPGRDGRAEIVVPRGGLRITLPKPCAAVELHLVAFGDEPLIATAFDESGEEVASARGGGRPRVPQAILLQPRRRGPITSVVVASRGGEAVLYRLCCLGAEAPGGIAVTPDGVAHAPLGTLAGAAAGGATGIVTGMVGDAPADDWPGVVVERKRSRDGRLCALVSFAPRDAGAGPWDGFRIEPPPGRTVALVSVCGIDQRAADARAEDVAVAGELAGILADVVAAEPDERREIVLQPGTEYELQIGWSWQAWQPDDPDDSPPAPDPGAWTPGAADVLRFATAPDTTLTEPQQDGLNEYRFDARDIGRYLIAVEPADGRAVQFTGDPVWVHFDAGHVEQLLELYGRTLAIEIHRTDPPPQPTQADLDLAHAPLETVTEWHALARDRQPTGYVRLNDALLDPAVAPCVPTGAPLGGASLAVHADMAPDADYDLEVVALEGSDRAVVLATRFHTSRYASPRALVDALGYASPGPAPYLPDDLLVPDGTALPAGGFVEGDAALDAALAAVDAETLPLPLDGARSYVLWSFDVATGWRVDGLVVDSPEPLKRERTVVGADGVPAQGTRMAPLHAQIGSSVLEPYRANARWTRVVFRPAAPIALAPGEHLLTLAFTTSGGSVTGSRRLLGVPSIIEREGL